MHVLTTVESGCVKKLNATLWFSLPLFCLLHRDLTHAWQRLHRWTRCPALHFPAILLLYYWKLSLMSTTHLNHICPSSPPLPFWSFLSDFPFLPCFRCAPPPIHWFQLALPTCTRLWGVYWCMGNRRVVSSEKEWVYLPPQPTAPQLWVWLRSSPPRSCWDFLLILHRSCASLTFSTFSHTEATGTAIKVFIQRQ